jgi:hypothetical protein
LHREHRFGSRTGTKLYAHIFIPGAGADDDGDVIRDGDVC